MFPLRDDIENKTFPIVTWTIIIANIMVFILELALQTAGASSLIEKFALTPHLLISHFCGFQLLTIFTCMFIHGDFLHVFGNLLFLHVFGHSVEDRFGHVGFLAFYLFAGLIASLAQIAVDPSSTIPIVGASGAISGVLGAYLIWFPRAQIVTALMYGLMIRVVQIPAMILLVFWFGIQILCGLADLIFKSGNDAEPTIAFWAHAGGFIAGVIVAKIMSDRNRLKPNQLQRNIFAFTD